MQWTWQARSCCVVLICYCCYIRVHGVVLCCASLFSSSLQLCCPSSGHQDRESPVLGFLQLFSTCASLRTNVCILLTLFNLLFLLHRFYSSLPVYFPELLLSLYQWWVCFSCIFCLILLSPDLFEKVNAALLPAAESALKLFCQPGPASRSHPRVPPPLPFWHVTLSGLSQQRWWLARTLTSHHFTWAFHSCPNKPDRTMDR